MSTLFKKIWNRNFVKGKESLDKMSEDLGGLQGEFSWNRIENGVITDTRTFHNDITQLSKSTVIRLLAQGTSAYKGTIDPTEFAISRMRFGNAPFAGTPNLNSTDYKTLAYYDDNEKSSRANLTSYTSGINPYASAGGNADGIAIPAESGSSKEKIYNISEASLITPTANGTFTIFIDGANFDNDMLAKRPPSHKTFKIEVYSNNLATTSLFTVDFTGIYTRSSDGNTGTVTLTGGTGSNGDWISSAQTKLFWSASSNKWQLLIKWGADSLKVSTIQAVKVTFKVGEYNIINSVVPKTGVNTGSGSASIRFPSSLTDYYSVNPAAVTYSDSPSNFIDDYSATFSVTMNTSEGNGANGVSRPVVYTEAFLFNSVNDLFSIVRFAPPAPYDVLDGNGFAKTPSQAYLISWTIKAII